MGKSKIKKKKTGKARKALRSPGHVATDLAHPKKQQRLFVVEITA